VTAPFFDWLRAHRPGADADGFNKADLREAQAELGPMCLLPPGASVAYVFAHPGPYFVPFSVEGWAFFVQQHVEAFAAAGVTAGSVVDVAVSFHLVPAGLAYEQALRSLGCTVVPGGAGQHAEHAALLQPLAVDWVIGFTSFLETVVAAAPDGVRLRGAVAVGEPVPPASALRVAAERVSQTYGTAETGPVAVSCDAGAFHALSSAGIRFSPDGELIVDVPGRPDGPMVGFRTGDHSEPVDCSCGRGVGFLPPVRPDTSTHRARGVFFTDDDVARALQAAGYDGPFRVAVTDVAARPFLALLPGPGGPVLEAEDVVRVLQERLRLRFVVEVATP